MAPSVAINDWIELEGLVEAFEAALVRSGAADPRDFLPPFDDPRRESTLGELLRVDLEHRFRRGERRSLADYRRDYPEVSRNGRLFSDLAFEEYRLRCQGKDRPSPDEYRRDYGVDPEGWPPPPDEAAEASAIEADRSDAALPCRAWPDAGDEFSGFELVRELGRGSFGRVFLARQTGLANRNVALKLSARTLSESGRLAKLQHSHIVPIYSTHESSYLTAICMPYFGDLTLADEIRRKRGHRASHGETAQDGSSTVRDAHWLLDSENQSSSDGLGESPADPAAPLQALPHPERSPAPVDNEKNDPREHATRVFRHASRLADALAHAHERGIVHRDIKPANVLLADDGRPMLLDFNLAVEGPLSGVTAAVGGTLPYMAPEQLAALQGEAVTLDARGDLFSLGVVLFEWLTGQEPYPRVHGSSDSLPAKLLADRRAGPPSPRALCPWISPAEDALVRRCLAPLPENRYPSAAELREDLDLHLSNRPLRHAGEPSWVERARKWSRRHPRLTSGVGVVTFAILAIAILATALWARNEQTRNLQATEKLHEFENSSRAAMYELDSALTVVPKTRDQGVLSAERSLAALGELDGGRWHKSGWTRRLPAQDLSRLRSRVGQLLLTLSDGYLSQAFSSSREEDRVERKWRAQVAHDQAIDSFENDAPQSAIDRQQERLSADSLSPSSFPAPEGSLDTAWEHYLAGRELALAGKYADAKPLLQKATRLDPTLYWAWLVLGRCHDELGEDADAIECYHVCVSLWPESPYARFNRGTAYFRAGRIEEAILDFDSAIETKDDFSDAYVNRGLARLKSNDAAGAIRDFDQALRLAPEDPRVFFMRAKARESQGDTTGAEADRRAGLAATPIDARGWIARALARAPNESDAALADLERALDAESDSLLALYNKGTVLAGLNGRLEEAVTTFGQLLEKYPDFVKARIGRAVLLARLGRREQAHADARLALTRSADAETVYMAGCVFSLTSIQHGEDRLEAMRLIMAAVEANFGDDLLATDTDLDPLRRTPEFTRFVAARQELRSLRPGESLAR